MATVFSDLRLWRWQRYTALATVPLVVAHVVLQYWVFGIESATFDAVSARLKGGAILAVDVLLLAAVGAHAFLGLRSVLQDYAKGPGAARLATNACLALVAATVLYGIAALVAFL